LASISKGESEKGLAVELSTRTLPVAGLVRQVLGTAPTSPPPGGRALGRGLQVVRLPVTQAGSSVSPAEMELVETVSRIAILISSFLS